MNKTRFLLDEGVIRLAELQEDYAGNPDATCLELLLAIERHCHSLLLSLEIWRRYCHHIDAVHQQPRRVFPGVMRIMVTLLANMEKDSRYLSEADLVSPPDLERYVKDDDQPFLQAAISDNGSVFVTIDGPLIQGINDGAFEAQFGFQVLRPNKALELIADP